MPKAVLAQIPNAITLARLVLSLALFVMLGLISAEPSALPSMLVLVAFVTYAIAAITDFIDGALARRWNVTSGFGRVVDPFVDKILVLGSFMMLAGPNFWLVQDGRLVSTTGVMPWLVVLLTSRELLITVLRQVAESRGKSFGADWSGKLKTTIQLLAIGAILLYLNYANLLPADMKKAALWLRDGLIWATAIITVISGIIYVQRAVRLVQTEEHQ